MSYIYETMYILRPDLGEELTEAAIAKYQKLLRDNNVEQIETQHRGKRRLAYEIGKYREGIYIQMNYKAEAHVVAILERSMRLSDDVIRFMTVKQEIPEPKPETVTA
ncbi:MAG: 30S ribosomal protein S6 [Oscillatoriaceae bacterium SKYG93]|nr:30S ribosomal protein S6 [Oscillatoriaceae bacterium SKYG93]MDW8452755.1 30S ribosomal protein S6 [Oscillatoriaceae cyanobacterium SKYGB_i_bin93]